MMRCPVFLARRVSSSAVATSSCSSSTCCSAARRARTLSSLHSSSPLAQPPLSPPPSPTSLTTERRGTVTLPATPTATTTTTTTSHRKEAQPVLEWMKSVSAAKVEPQAVHLLAAANTGKVLYSIDSLWLRDHCRCPECYHTRTHQRLFDTYAVSSVPVHATIVMPSQSPLPPPPSPLLPIPPHLGAPSTTVAVNEPVLRVWWGADSQEKKGQDPATPSHVSDYAFSYLRSLFDPNRHSRFVATVRGIASPGAQQRVPVAASQVGADLQRLWRPEELAARLPVVHHDSIMSSEHERQRWLRMLNEYGVTIIEGVPVGTDGTRKLCERVCGGLMRNSHYGMYWEFTADMAFSDTACTNIALPCHTDGTYFYDTPGLQLLSCLEFDGTGGQSVIVDGAAIVAELKATQPEMYDTLRRVSLLWQDLDEDCHQHYQYTAPVITEDEDGRVAQIRYNNCDRSDMPHPDMQSVRKVYDALRTFDRMVSDRQNQYWFQLVPGRAFLFDNWRLLHGRNSFTGRRRLGGCYLSRDDYVSQLRLALPA